MITPEKIKEIAERPRGAYELELGELQAIYTAAEKSPFEMICYAYAYGFYRGQRQERDSGMEKRPETLEDLLCYLECARDSLLMIHNVIEAETATPGLLMNAVYGTYNHLDYIAKSMMKHIDKIPLEIMEKAGREVGA